MFNKIFKKYFFLIGIILFLIILSKSNLREIYENIKNINSPYLIIAALLIFPMLINKTWCWHYILKQQGIKYRFRDLFSMYCSGLYIGLLTPARMGEITRALYLKKDGHSMGKSLAGIILDRLSDFAFLLFFVFFGSLFFVTVFQKQILIFVLGTTAAVILFLIFLKIGLVSWFLNNLFRILVIKKYQKSWKVNFQDFINNLKIYKLKHYLIIFLITAFSWLFYYFITYLLAKGLELNVSILYLAIAVTVAGFITLLPISISGIGTRDAALLGLFAPFAISIEKILAFSALILSVSLFTVLIGLICWLIKPLKL